MNMLRKWWRLVRCKDSCPRRTYLASADHPRLHLGASNRVLDGWLNTDIAPGPSVSYLDATKPFPFSDMTFEYVYAEHMIEHVAYEDAALMIVECFRVLQPGGVLRIVTPNLDAILRSYSDTPTAQATAYLQWMTKTFVPDAPASSASYVINAMFRLWGHQFIYDLQSLSTLFAKAGFANITLCSIDHSSYPLLRNLSNASRYPEGLLEFESLCVEATRPGH